MKNRETNDSGIALIVALLFILLLTIMMLGFYFQTTGEQNVAASDRDNTVTFYAAQGAIENMSSNIGTLFESTASPTPAQIAALTGASYQQNIPIYNGLGTLTSQAVTYPVYTIVNQATATCIPTATTLCSTSGIIPGNGPLAGLMGILTPFTLTVVAEGPNNTEVKMTRQVQEVAVPVFQYGIFSQSDLSFFAGPNFGFGGRTATNGNLFLAEGDGTLTLNDKVTAFGDVVRTELSNGVGTAAGGYINPVDITIGSAGGCPTPTCPACPTATCRALALTEGSVTGGPGSAAYAGWQTLSMNTYGGYIRSGATGVKQLNLALALANTSPIAMIQRAPAGESVTSTVGQQRFFNQASVRILLSDTQGQITSLPAVTGTRPYPLAEGATSGMGNVIQRTSSGSSYYLPPTDACHPPVALSPGYPADHDYMSPVGTTLLGGYIKIEVQLNSNPGTWQDVTQEVLSLGISRDTMTTGVVTLGTPGTTSTNSTLTTNNDYYYEVTALGPWGETLPSSQVTGEVTSDTKSITLSWNAVTGATGYKLYRTTTSGTYTGAGNGYIQLTVNTAQTGWAAPWDSYTDSNATAFTSSAPPAPCTNMSILHLEGAIPGVPLGTTSYTTNTNYIPLNIYDPREGELRDTDVAPTPPTASLNGVMNILEVDVGRLQQWLANTLCTASTVPTSCPSGALAWNNSGYILYVSDRRGNCNQTAAGPCTGNDTGEYGNEDTINPTVEAGTPNGVLDTAAPGTGSCPPGPVPCPIEDVDGDGVFRTYGATPHPLAIDSTAGSPWPAFITSITNPATTRIRSGPASMPATCTAGAGCVAQKNSVVVFRHAVRLVDGRLGSLPPLDGANLATCPNAAVPAAFPSLGGFSLAAENPVYILGDYNASSSVGAFSPDPSGKCHVPAAVFADAVTLLSNSWVDGEDLAYPTNVGGRPGTSNTFWRVAIIGGKNNSFPNPTYAPAPRADFGTDGGTHNFLRFIENWGSTANYRGSMVSFYIARQATGVYKYTVVYAAPTRAFNYDTDFTNITSLPPGAPRFTDVNALSYQQSILATQ